MEHESFHLAAYFGETKLENTGCELAPVGPNKIYGGEVSEYLRSLQDKIARAPDGLGVEDEKIILKYLKVPGCRDHKLEVRDDEGLGYQADRAAMPVRAKCVHCDGSGLG